jgi:hypothetical protein
VSDGFVVGVDSLVSKVGVTSGTVGGATDADGAVPMTDDIISVIILPEGEGEAGIVAGVTEKTPDPAGKSRNVRMCFSVKKRTLVFAYVVNSCSNNLRAYGTII